MMIDIKVPVFPESVADGTLSPWHKKVGDFVRRDDNLIDIETDKVMLELPAPADGRLAEILVEGGEQVTSGQIIARLDTEADQREEVSAAKTATALPAAAALSAESSATEQAKTRLSPAARKLMVENDLEPAQVSSRIREGLITKTDVLEYLDQHRAPSLSTPAVEPPSLREPPAAMPEVSPVIAPEEPIEHSGKRVPMTRLRARIAERLVEVQQTAAILTTFNEIDMQPVRMLRDRYRQRFEKLHGVRLGYMSFFTAAAVAALQRFPIVNASIDGHDIVYHDYFDIGIAVSTDRGLVVPVLRNADRMSFAEIEAAINEYGVRAHEGKLSIEDLTGGTFSITNGGVFGSLLSTPILNPPQSAILGMHKIEDRPVVVEGQITVRPMMYVALSYDHRIIDGRDAVQFLVTIKEALEDPVRLLIKV